MSALRRDTARLRADLAAASVVGTLRCEGLGDEHIAYGMLLAGFTCLLRLDPPLAEAVWRDAAAYARDRAGDGASALPALEG